MTRSIKKSGSSTRKQPATRRARQGNVRKRTSGSATSLRKTTKHPSTRPPALEQDEPLPDLASASPRASDTDEAGGGAPRGASERPVAHSLKPESRAAESRQQKSSAWVYLAAAVVLGGGLWLALGNSGGNSGKPDETAGKPDETASKPDMAPAARAEVQQSPPAAPSPQPAAQPDQAEQIIELDEPEAKEPGPPVVQRRVLAAKPARKAREPETEPAPAEVGPFDRGAANSALSNAAAQASACRQEGDPTGVAKVVVTFAPSGRVTSATINGPPFAGTQTGSCIAKTMRGMNLPPFQGDLMTISKTVVIM